MYAAVRENLATLISEADAVGRGLPRYVQRDFTRYLDCGQLANGFARVRCEACGDELQVAFSCKGRGVCPSCNHALVPDGVFTQEGAFVPLPPPTQPEVERLLARVRRRVLALLAARGVLEAEAEDDSLERYRAHSLRGQLALLRLDVRAPPRQQPRCAFFEGFSLHANTHLHPNDREGLARLCRYGARGPLALERFERAPDGRIAYRMKRVLPGGRTHLHFTGLELLRKLTALVPPPRSNLVRFHGVFAPGARLRAAVAPVPASALAASGEAAAAVHVKPVAAASRARTPRLDWAGLLQRTFALDVFRCTRCGGKRRVLAYLTHPPVVRAILAHVGEATGVAPLAAAQGPPGWE
ncbi:MULTISPECIES: transposase [Myxococcaceae]|uniref:transposase n=1 Tax=Myxococcaceae TaxID=31 RepID=UPI00188F24AD|nr:MULTISPECIES: transposase [Myxococcaceae]MBF5043284.1 transposase [Simulacricoccus sp. 17bor-14]